jgi:predicted dehydrogenase
MHSSSPPSQLPAPKVVVAGCGYWGKNLVRNFHALGALAGVVDPSPAGRELARSLAPGVPIHASLDEALAPGGFAGLAIATPACTHFSTATQALNAGLDVFVEKPISLDVAEAARMVAHADAAGRMLQVGHILEYHPALPVLRDWVATGRFGQLRRLQAHRTNWGMIRTEEDALWSIAPHDIAVMLRLIGRLPETVAAHGTHILGTPRADAVVARLMFSEGVEGHLLASWHHPVKEQRIMVVGEKGMALFDDLPPDNKLSFYDEYVRWPDGKPELVKSAPEFPLLAKEEPLRRECQAFLDAISSRRPPLADGHSGLRVLRVLDACRRSMHQGGAPVPCLSHPLT